MKPTQQISSFFDDIRSASHADETEEHNAIDGLRDMINTFDSVDDVLINCRNKSCDLSRLDSNHVSPQRLCSMMRKYTAPDDVAGPMGTEWPVTRGADGDGLPVMNRKKLAQRSDILITRQWMRNQLWKVANWHRYLHASSPDPELRPSFVIEIAKDTLRICGMFAISLMEVHGVGLVRPSSLVHDSHFADDYNRRRNSTISLLRRSRLFASLLRRHQGLIPPSLVHRRLHRWTRHRWKRCGRC